MTSLDTDPIISELANGAELSLENAEELFHEAVFLFKHGSICRSYFLHQISIEECGKIELLGRYATAHLMDFPLKTKKIKSSISNHKAKNTANAYMLPRSEDEENALKEKDWKKAINAFNEQKRDFHQKSNSRKNASLYVDYKNEKFLSPKDQITEKMVQEIAENNYKFIELIRPKVQMFAKWKQEPSVVKENIKVLQNLMEKLKEEHPDDPYMAVDDLCREMLEKYSANKANSADAKSRAAD